MIRFCDREVDCIEYCSLSDNDAVNRADLLMYFLKERKDAVVCVYDDFSIMGFMGIITYQSLSSSLTFRGALQMDYLMMDENIWEEARLYFKKHVEYSGWDCLIPVIDQKGELICFAYNDADANREIRQLRELSEMSKAIQFADVYPEYKFVKIHGFNELAYFFARYLESQHIAVCVEGEMWRGFFTGNECSVPDYECLHIYAEGTWEKNHNWKENLLRSVSVEFECIDRIYEANIKGNVIENIRGNGDELLARLRGEKEIVLCGTGREELNACDYLKGNGIEVCGFIGTQKSEEYGHQLFGKKIMSSLEARAAYKEVIFIDCKAQNSAWGFGGVDFYDYIGYGRNERFVLLRDYFEIPENNLMNLLRNQKIVLTGEINLCRRLSDFLQQCMIPVEGFLYTKPEDHILHTISEICVDDIEENTLCLIVVAEYYKYKGHRWEGGEKRSEIKSYLIQNRIYNYTEYFSDMISFIGVEKKFAPKYTKEWLQPHAIVLGAIEAGNGNEFFRALLDSHPEIMMMYYSDLNSNLFWLCVYLAMEETTNILPVFWKMIEGNEAPLFNAAAFNEKMSQLLETDNKFTSQELFVMFHIAYMYMCGRDIIGNDIKNMIIYWEPHHVIRATLEECALWLGEGSTHCDIINVVRNICMQSGTGIKCSLDQGMRGVYNIALNYPSIEKKIYEKCDRMTIRFEDLKCNPKETLLEICNRWGIRWSDTLMETTHTGKRAVYADAVHKVTGFDLEPVYNTYEQFFSAFDRFRLMLISAPWQRKYGYPYVELLQFSRKELQEMFLKGFRFENLFDTELNTGDLDYRIWLQAWIREKLQKTRMIELIDRNCS